MSGRLQIVLVICSLLFLILTIHSIKKDGLDLYHSILWFAEAIVLLFMAAFPGAADWAAGILGIKTASNFVFTILIAFLLINSLSVSASLSRQHDRIRKLVQKEAILENRLTHLEKEYGKWNHRREADHKK